MGYQRRVHGHLRSSLSSAWNNPTQLKGVSLVETPFIGTYDLSQK